MTPPTYTAAGARPEIVTESLPIRRPSWVAQATSGDHKTVGRMFIGAALIFLASTLTLLVMMRIQLIIPDNDFMRPQIFDRMLSAYGVSAVLLFAMPLLMGLISYIVPLQIGARGVALPRLGALSFWLYVGGGAMLYASFLWSPGEGGTLALPPLSVISAPNNGVNAWAGGVALLCLSMIAFAVNMVTTVRRDRAPGMVWRRVPLFSFGATVVSWTMLVIGPIMAAAVTMLLIDRNFSGVFFDSGRTGRAAAVRAPRLDLLHGRVCDARGRRRGHDLGDLLDLLAPAGLRPAHDRRLDGRLQRARRPRLDAEHVLRSDPRRLPLRGDAVRGRSRRSRSA